MAWEERLHFVFSFSIVVCFYCDWFPMFFVYAFVGVTKNSCCWNVHNASQCIIAQHKAPEGLNRFPLRLFQWKSLVSSCFSLWTFHGPAIWACAGVATPEKKAKPTKWDKLDQHASRFDQMVVAHELPSVRLRDDQVPETPQRSRGERDARQD